LKILVRILLGSLSIAAAAGAWRSGQRLRGNLLAAEAGGAAGGERRGAYVHRMERALELDPLQTNLAVRFASERAGDGDLEGALRTISGGSALNESLPALFLEGAILAEQHRSVEATRIFEKLQRISPTDRGVVQNLLRLRSGNEGGVKAQELADDADLRWPGAFDTLALLGNLQLKKGDEESAIRFFRAALAAAQPGEDGVVPPRAEPEVFDPVVVARTVRTHAAMTKTKHE